ncbi:MAG: hypothetical protein GF398_02740 [Chitinivibrionales bacterium]|nr:hypothetical protein [Chitinivibrionales bacterium]
MKLLHTKLPEFLTKLKQAALKQGKKARIRGLENLRFGKVQSLRTGRIEHGIEELANRADIDNVEVVVVPRVPETMHTVILMGHDANGKCAKAILEVVNILHPTEDYELGDCPDIEDRRPLLGKH